MKIAEKKEVLNGRGVVVSYANGKGSKGYFYRERIEGTKKYRQKKIEGADNLIEAVEMAMDTALEMREEEPHHLSLLTTTNPKDDGLSLLQREEKVLRKKERLARLEKKKENPQMTIHKALEE